MAGARAYLRPLRRKRARRTAEVTTVDTGARGAEGWNTCANDMSGHLLGACWDGRVSVPASDTAMCSSRDGMLIEGWR